MASSLTRRSAFGLLLGASSGLLPLKPAAAANKYFNVVPGAAFKPLPIAVTQFAGGSTAAQITSIITHDFSRSVFIEPLDPKTFIDHPTNPDVPPRMSAWKAIHAQFVATGRAVTGGNGKLNTEFRLWDVTAGKQIAGEQYVTDPNNVRRVAHIIADAIFTRLTGEKGFFDTRVVFVDETGPRIHRRKRLAIMDMDGANVRYLTSGNELVVTPRFSPTAQVVTYMAFGSGHPKVLLLNLETGHRQVVGNFSGMTFAPRFSPDGQKVIYSVSENGISNIYTTDLRTHATQRLSHSSAIDTSPSYSPDESRIVFCSDRGGTEQLYVMPAAGGGAKRISFGDGRYSTPVWSPRGDFIAFTKQAKGLFAIGVMKPDGTGERILTEGYDNEGPTWAPNGLFLMFFKDPGGNAGPHIHMIDLFGRSDFLVPTPSYASDPAWGPLLSAK